MLLAGLDFKSESIVNLNLNNGDLLQTLINLFEEKVVYTHPNYSVVTIIRGKWWQKLWNNFNYKYAKIEPVSYYFEVIKNEDEDEENVFLTWERMMRLKARWRMS